MTAFAPVCDRLAPPAEFEVQVEPDREPGLVVPVGELDIATAPALRDRVEDLVAAGCEDVLIDLREVEFIDCSGLGLLLGLHATARRDGWRLSLVQGPPTVRRLFALTRTLDALPFAVDARRHSPLDRLDECGRLPITSSCARHHH